MITNRETLAEALSTIPGVTGYKSRPDLLIDGVAYPLVGPFTRGPANTFERNWRLIFIHGGDEWIADDWLTDVAPIAVDKLQHLVFVDVISPIAVPTGEGDLFATELIARSE